MKCDPSCDESRDVYQLFVERNARASTLVTSNRDTNEWLAMFDDMLLAQSAVDRFANNAYDLVIEGESYRPRLKPNRSQRTAAQEVRRVTRANLKPRGPQTPIQKQPTHPRKRSKPKAT